MSRISYGFNIAVGGVTLDGFEIKGAQHGIYIAPGSHFDTVDSCIIQDANAVGKNAKGIFIEQSDNVTPTRNVIYNIKASSHTPWNPVG